MTITGTISVFPGVTGGAALPEGENVSPYILAGPVVPTTTSESPEGTLGGLALARVLQRRILKPEPYGCGSGGQSVDQADIVNNGFNYGLGGGIFAIYAAGAVSITGSIHADGGGPGEDNNSEADGGGAGGIIILASKTSIDNAGTLSAEGGQGNANVTTPNGVTSPGGGGGGGIIHLLSPSNTVGTPIVTGGLVGSGASPNGANGGGGGGACGGNGGAGTIDVGAFSNQPPISAATAGLAGIVFNDTVADPASLILP